MRILTLLLGLSMLLFAIPGCESSADRLLEERIALIGELADAYDNDAPQETIDELNKRIEENTRKLDELKLASEAQRGNAVFACSARCFVHQAAIRDPREWICQPSEAQQVHPIARGWDGSLCQDKQDTWKRNDAEQ